jgi:DNA invertase Pin-like site-specific DNA recombinase
VKKSNSRKGRDTTAALYARLSRDDNLDGESYSISNQKTFLTKIAKEKGFTNLLVFADDGISGVTMERPAYKEMIAAIEDGKVSAVFVKDMTRLGRNYIEVGRLTEEFFIEHEVRLISVSDGIDTKDGENEFAPFINIMSEWYARDISKKRRISNVVKGNSGEPLGLPPYGYEKDPDRPKYWRIDKEAARVVRHIFQMSLDGVGTEQIARALEREKVLTPLNHWKEKGIIRPGKKQDVGASIYCWNSSTVSGILHRQEYCGDVLNFKTYSKSYKHKKRIDNERENWTIFKDVHEPIVLREDYEKVQAKRGKVRKRMKKDGERNMFSGLVVCADCGSNLHYHFNQGNHEIRYFNCSNYNKGKGCTSTHYVRVDFLEQVVLQEILRITRFATIHEKEFTQLVTGFSQKNAEVERQAKKRELNILLQRDAEIDTFFNRMYEDSVSGRITEERFARMSTQYTDEQAELAERIKELKSVLEQSEKKTVTADMFLAAVRKYTRAKQLTPRMLNELIEKIEVFQAEKCPNEHHQRLRIHYNCVGTMEIPDIPTLAEPEIRIETRKGVAINYSVTQTAP